MDTPVGRHQKRKSKKGGIETVEGDRRLGRKGVDWSGSLQFEVAQSEVGRPSRAWEQ